MVIYYFSGLLGCLGATNEKGVLLKVYFAMLLVLVILQIIAGIVAASQKDTVRIYPFDPPHLIFFFLFPP